MSETSNISPVVRRPRPQTRPGGNAVVRALRALLVERRLPYRLHVLKELYLQRAGFVHKTMKTHGHVFTVRRRTRDEDFVREVIEEGVYFGDELQLPPDGTVIDVGGNIGTFTVVIAKRVPRGRVLVVEPETENFELLQRNIARNRLTNVIPVQAALGSQQGSIRLYLSRSDASGYQTGSHSIHPEIVGSQQPSEADYVDVPARRLQDLFDEQEIACCDLLKLDCEGAEYDILYNLPQEYLRRILRITMEFHVDRKEDKRLRGDELVHFLQRQGFEILDYVDLDGYPMGLISAARPATGQGPAPRAAVEGG